MLKGFKEFITRGNVIELAIGVVIGVAFQAMVDAVVKAIITPMLVALGGTESNGLGFHIIAGKDDTFVNFSNVINAVIVFLLTALVVYVALVLPMNKLAERRAAKRAAMGIVEPETPPSTEELLAEIRDLLAKNKQV